ncbi:MAG TPA: GAF domain-containing protein [Ktedonobacteraceae bacterium]|nr:GAF domain-containing protein [Ktedonobacteraceae bacterium]
MPVFEVTSRIAQSHTTSKIRRTRVRRRWRAFLRFSGAVLITVVLSAILFSTNLSNLFFILLPVFVTIVWSPAQLSRLLHGTWLYGVLTICLEILYFSAITGIEFFIHTPGFGLLYLYHGPPIPMIIVVTTTLAWAIMLAPLRTFGRAFIQRRFNRRDYAATRAVEAFTSTLREEIDLDRVRDGLLAVVQQTMRPQVASVWVRKAVQHDRENLPAHAEPQVGEQLYAPSPREIPIAADDPLLAFALHHHTPIEVEHLQLNSPIVRNLREHGIEIALPLASQGKLIGLIALGRAWTVKRMIARTGACSTRSRLKSHRLCV